MKYEINVQLGSIPVEGRIARLMVEAPDQETAKSMASIKALAIFEKTFGNGHPILTKSRRIVLCEVMQVAND